MALKGPVFERFRGLTTLVLRMDLNPLALSVDRLPLVSIRKKLTAAAMRRAVSGKTDDRQYGIRRCVQVFDSPRAG